MNTKRHKGLRVFFVFLLAVPHGMWDLSSPTRDRTRPGIAPSRGSMEFEPLDHQGSPIRGCFIFIFIFFVFLFFIYLFI